MLFLRIPSISVTDSLFLPDLVPLSPRGGDRARQPGAGGAGHGDVGQRLRAVGPRALRRARQGDVGAGGRRAQHEVEGGVRQGPQRGEPLLPRLQGVQVGDVISFNLN